MAKLDYVCCKECKPPKRYPGCKTNAGIGIQIENVRRNKKRKHENGK